MTSDPLIACIDDSKAVCDAIAGFLKALGFRAAMFSSAEEFLQSNLLEQTSCLITDIKLPGMSGLQLLNQLASSGSRVPTIVITAFSGEHVRAQALRAGVICVLDKPVAKDDLLACIRSALERSEKF
ncbi:MULTISPECIES: response regulator [unclassified Bradyrhizobium]|uniref:response regulator transcription factor n=1 Tax=unclassified Bradyrhizobium TaxID=2631580 RepID=UPI0024B27E06|nr:response regulator [Bradyrhizobium sp. CB2312]WFU75061.1 response regulator [Bradyrhizobium sp. CB2312]